METIPEEDNVRRPVTLSERVKETKQKADLLDKIQETEQVAKFKRFPFKWMMKFRSAKKKNGDTALVLFFNKKNEIEPPQFLPIYSGNMIVYNNKAYVFDPRAIWRMKIRGYPMVYCIKEIDRRPIMNKKGEAVYKNAAISNLDLEEVRRRGDSTESDEFLIKAALKAQTTTIAGKSSWIIGGVVLLLLIGAVIWFVTSGPKIG